MMPVLSRSRAATLLVLAAKKAGTLVSLGDLPGHEFHGNQWTGAFNSLIERISAPDSGFTYSMVTGTEPTTGYVLSIHKDREQALPLDKVDLDHLMDYAKKNDDLLSKPENYLGAWHDPVSHKVFLDVSSVTQDEKEAATLAKEFEQLAYFDLGTMTSVPVTPHEEIRRHLASYGFLGRSACWPDAGRFDPALHEVEGASPLGSRDRTRARALACIADGYLRGLGDVVGHEFHGNQWTGGEGGNPRAITEHESRDISKWGRANQRSAQLTRAERSAVIEYRRASAFTINEQLRTGTVTTETERIVSHLDSAIQKAVVDKDVTVYRGIATDLKLEKGKIFTDKGFTATTFSAEQAALNFAVGPDQHSTVLELYVPKGSHGLFTEGIAPRGMEMNAGREHELLLPRDSSIQITHVHREGNTIYVRGHVVSRRTLGGSGSGNFGHAGRPGEVGGSSDGPGAPGSSRTPAPRVKTIEDIVLYHNSPDVFPEGKPLFDAYFGNADFRQTFPNEWGQHTYAVTLPKGTKVLDLTKDTPEARNFRAKMAEIQFPKDTAYHAQLRAGDPAALTDFYDIWTDKDVIVKALKDTGYSVVHYASEYVLTKALLAKLKGQEIKTAAAWRALGGAGSGNFGHSGRPGEVGGSDSSGTERQVAFRDQLKQAGFQTAAVADLPQRVRDDLGLTKSTTPIPQAGIDGIKQGLADIERTMPALHDLVQSDVTLAYGEFADDASTAVTGKTPDGIFLIINGRAVQSAIDRTDANPYNISQAAVKGLPPGDARTRAIYRAVVIHELGHATDFLSQDSLMRTTVHALMTEVPRPYERTIPAFLRAHVSQYAADGGPREAAAEIFTSHILNRPLPPELSAVQNYLRAAAKKPVATP